MNPEARFRQGLEELRRGERAAAETSFREVLRQAPAQPAALHNLGVLLIEAERHADLLVVAEQALAAEPGQPHAQLARGNALLGLGRFVEAAQAFDAAAAHPAVAQEARSKLGQSLAGLARYEEALAALDAAVALDPQDPAARFRRGLLRLQLGHWREGWEDYAARWQSPPFLAQSRGVVPAGLVPQLAQPASPEDLAGKRVLVLGEQGVGDQVMFASMVPDLARSAAAATLVVDPRLVRLFSASFEGVTVAGPDTAAIPQDAVDVVVPIGGLGRAFRNDVADFPGAPYLHPRAEVVARWRERLGPAKGLRVGLSWRGGTPGTRRNSRSVGLDALQPLLQMPGLEFVSLQYGEAAAEIGDRPIRHFPPAEIDDFEDLAGLVANLDLVVSVQTALVHLCGALGKACLTLVPNTAEWRYGATGDAMPWYGSVRLVRQAHAGDWMPVVREVAGRVAATARAQAPSDLAALINRGVALEGLGQAAEAEAHYRQALAVRPLEPTALGDLALLLQTSERFTEALALADETLAAQPGHPAALIARGNALTALDRHAEALEAFTAADPDTEARTKAALALAALGRFDEAFAAFDALPDWPAIRFQRGMLRLQRRDFARGWADYEARWATPSFLKASRGVVPAEIVPRLTLAPEPSDLAGQRILLMAEQGVGDQVMFASMLPDLAGAAAAVTLVCDPRLVALFAASFPRVSVTGPAEANVRLDAVDRFVALGSLGHAFRREVADFPGAAYLRPRPETVARWAQRLGPSEGRLRVGLSWRGGLPRSRRSARSIPLDQLAPILGLDGCEFVSLQYGDVAAELEGQPVRSFPPAEIDDFDDLAALVVNLDLVVSVQTAVVHLAGALGAPCLAMVPQNNGWRYMTDDERVPWYRSVRLIRQPTPGDWAPVLDEVVATLEARGAG